MRSFKLTHLNPSYLRNFVFLKKGRLTFIFPSLFTVTAVQLNVFPHAGVESQGGERLRRPRLGGWRSNSAAGVAAGLAVVPVATQVDLKS